MFQGVLVGHATDTGCADGLRGHILCGGDAVGGVDIRGSATGSCELHTLNPGHVAPNVHAIVLSGGSAFGLETTCGVRNLLEKRGIGYNAGVTHVPIVPGAILFDLGIRQPRINSMPNSRDGWRRRQRRRMPGRSPRGTWAPGQERLSARSSA